ncbi:MAG: hypothetical protein AAF481_17325 [Acidobacteriota bacterium]
MNNLSQLYINPRDCKLPPYSSLDPSISGVVFDDAIRTYDQGADGNRFYGVMLVEPWDSPYGQIDPGAIWLLPGYIASDDPDYRPYTGQAYINRYRIGTLDPRVEAGHKQMVDQLSSNRADFLGFSLVYPLGSSFDDSNCTYNSWTCNDRQDHCGNTLPAEWQEVIYDALAYSLLPDSDGEV